MSLDTLPTTNLRIVVSLCLAVLYVVVLLLLFGLKIEVPTELAIAVGTFILAMLGIDLAQFGIKRATYKPESPQPPQE